MPTSQQDPERARLQRATEKVPDWAMERDWMGMLLGIALALGGVTLVTGVIHLYLRLAH